ncbi:unnamed protein product [Ambrosiozyma monospora]|uniref:Unnamed protein product n=1 Tax=Ambrosiozyma monospora TaxID=43982 RepID=A0ACB5T1N8_AMBMO|nr:unnamed protein product [Ambrosiozyma monospora]
MRVAMAIALRKSGQSKEAAYQLQIASNQENREAMLLYGLSLRYGYGVKKDLDVSFLWICKAASIDSRKKYEFKIDPKILLTKANKKALPTVEPDCSIYFEIGQAFLNGWGCTRNVKQGVEFIEKSGSLGYSDAMCEAGMLWASKKRNSLKKDMKRAAAWFRLADLSGAELIGSDWIYNKKYM